MVRFRFHFAALFLPMFTCVTFAQNVSTPYKLTGTTITFYSGYVNDADMVILDSHPEITSITFVSVWKGGGLSGAYSGPGPMDFDISPQGFVHIANCKNLETLIFDEYKPLHISSVTFRSLTGLKLKVLHLGASPVSDDAIQRLGPITTLVDFDSGQTILGDSTLRVLSNCKQLHRLKLTNSVATDDGLSQIAGLTQLEELNLRSTAIGDKSGAFISRLTNLKSLDLGRTKITDNGLVDFDRLVRLQSLYLDETRINGSTFDSLGLLPKLEQLYLSKTLVDDAGLMHLAKLPMIKTIDLSGTPITDTSISILESLKTLTVIGLDDTAIKSAASRIVH
jgi:Leucine-rich repeat (LRR) protein